MTDLDDALNTSAPMFSPVRVVADWAELPPGYSSGLDSLRELGPQIGPDGFTVSQSFDDGLPDPVTMTTSNDASGSMSMDLTGRPANRADNLTGWRAGTASGFGTGTSIAVTMPAGIQAEDYVLVAIMVDNQSGVYEANFDPGHPHGWKLLAEVSDGSATLFTTYLFGRSHWTASPAPDFRIVTSADWSWCAGAIGAHYTAVFDAIVPVKPGTVTTAIESVIQTGHVGPIATLPSRGYLLGVFATRDTAAPWTVVSGGTELVEATGGLGAIQMVKTDLITLDGDYGFSSSTDEATGIAMMFNVPLIIADRPAMDARQYFSPFNEESPIQKFDRDTAAITTEVNVVTPNGIYATPVFAGQMADIKLTERTAQLQAVSRTRILLDGLLTLPKVNGDRENCTSDYLATWILAHGGQYPGVAPSPFTRFWATGHGSTYANVAGGNAYSTSIYDNKDRIPKGPYGLRPPSVVPGPFVTAMFGQQTHQQTDSLYFGADKKSWPDTVPGQVVERHDLISQQNSVGRLTFWIRGDATDALPDSLVGAGTTYDLFDSTLIIQQGASGAQNYLSFRIDATRRPVVYLESGVTLTGGDIPTDGQWHFVGFTWNYASGLCRTRRDNVTWNTSGFTSSTKALAKTEASVFAAGRDIQFLTRSRLPIAELQLEAGPDLYTEQFSRFWPAPTAPSLNTVYRPSNQPIIAVAETAPVKGWSALQGIAQSYALSLRVNEEDNVELVPLSYFGEDEQLTVETINVVDTDINAADPDVTLDPTKTRNVVTVEYAETRIDSNRSPLLEISSPIEFVRGTQDITFSLDTPAAEIHGAIDPYGTGPWKLVFLTAAQIAGSSPLPNENFLSVNRSQDGSAATNVLSGLSARVIAWTSGTVTIRFVNPYSTPMWISNNGQQIPFLRILGYPIRTVDSYETVRDPGSIGTRRERALTAGVQWIQTRQIATEFAGTLVTMLSRPRPEMGVTVMGDPRRRPGQLVAFSDVEGTRAGGTWRILKAEHQGNGPMYLQHLQLVYVGPPGLWDEGLWDDAIWGE